MSSSDSFRQKQTDPGIILSLSGFVLHGCRGYFNVTMTRGEISDFLDRATFRPFVLVTHAAMFRVPHPDFIDIPPHDGFLASFLVPESILWQIEFNF